MANTTTRDRGVHQSHRKQVPIREGLFVLPAKAADTGHLVGSKCAECGEVFFPTRPRCAVCFGADIEEVAIGRTGMLYSYTVVRARPPDPYKGPEPFQPYAIGSVELPEGVRVLALLTDVDVNTIPLGIPLDLTFETQYVNAEGEDVVIYKYRPARPHERD